MKRLFLLGAIALAATAVGAFALDALKPGGAAPAQVVSVRMAAMQANVMSFGDIQAKITAGQIKAIAANARSLMVLGAVIPTVLTDKLSDAYPAGSKFFFKGGPADDIVAKAQGFVDAAEALAVASEKGDAASMKALTASLFASCGACHALYRGSL